MWTSAMHFLYFSHHCFHWLLWYCAIVMLSLVKIVAAKANCLHLDCIFASSWIKLFRSVTFLMTKEREMMQLTFIRWARISLHACLIFCIQSLTWLRNVILSYSMFRWTCSELVNVSAFKVSMLTLLNIFATWCRVWFCSVSSLHSLFDNSLPFSRWCQTDASNAISDLITAEYTCLAFVKIIFHVKTLSRLSASIHVTWFTSIWRRCTSHRNFMFSCTLRTCMSDFNLITELFICMLIIMSNLFDFLMKCVNSYFSDANVVSWVQAHFAQMSCALLSVLQISSMNLLYARMLMSFTKSSTSILIFSALHFLIRLTLKNRKRINEIKNLCDMFAFILRISLVCSLNLNDVSPFSRKLCAHSTMYSEVLFIFKVCRSLMCKTQSNALMIFKLSMNAMYLISQSHIVWTWSTSRFNVMITNRLHLALI